MPERRAEERWQRGEQRRLENLHKREHQRDSIAVGNGEMRGDRTENKESTEGVERRGERKQRGEKILI